MIAAHEEKSFVGWMRENSMMFTGDEYHFRLGVWLSNKRYVQQHNAGNSHFILAMNRLSHLTPSEYHSLLGYKNSGRNHKYSIINEKNAGSHPDSFDWRDHPGVIGPVKDQNDCGSCWAFSTIFGLESNWAVKHNAAYILSEQNLVDCCSSAAGCNGGFPADAWDWMIDEQGGKTMLEVDYPYTSQEGTCKWNKKKAAPPQVKGYVEVADCDENDLAEKIANLGPASIAIDASLYSFMMYQSGIYDDPKCSSMNLDHAVGCVGYGVENGAKYWIDRNSWGEMWGEKGYIRMARDKDNQCGVATEAFIAQVN